MAGRVVAARYELGREIGRGAMATVYAARDLREGRDVAVKLIHPHVAGEDRVRQRLGREVSVASKIAHPNVVRILDSGVEPSDGSFFIVMELLAGETLLEQLRRGELDARAALDLVLQLLEPLATAHASGVVHRDLKPANVFITKNADGSQRVTLLDFGIARDLDGGSLTRTESMLGTPQYMAPEQAMDAKRASTAADVWAVGILLYFVLSRTHPFEGESAYDVVIRACTQPHAPLSTRVRGLDPRLEALVDRCLSKEPSARPADARQLRGELHALLALEDVQRSLTQLEPLPRTPAPSIVESTSSTADVPGPPILSPRESAPSPVEPPRPPPAPSPTLVDAEPRSNGRVALVAVAVGLAAIFAASWILRTPSTPESAPIDAGLAETPSKLSPDPIALGTRTASSSMVVTSSIVQPGPDAGRVATTASPQPDAAPDAGPRAPRLAANALRDAAVRASNTREDARTPEPATDPAPAEITNAPDAAVELPREVPRETPAVAEPTPAARESATPDASIAPARALEAPRDAGLPRGPADRPVEAAPPAKKKPKPFLTF